MRPKPRVMKRRFGLIKPKPKSKYPKPTTKKSIKIKSRSRKQKSKIKLNQISKTVKATPEFITDLNKVNVIRFHFNKANQKLERLKKVKDPVKEKKLRRKVFSEFENSMKKEGFLLSYQKLAGEQKAASERFYSILARDFYNHTTKQLSINRISVADSILANLQRKNRNLTGFTYKKLGDYIDRSYFEAMYFLQGDDLRSSANIFKKRLEDVPKTVKSSVIDFLVNECSSSYNMEVKEYMSMREIDSDIISNAYASLVMKLSFLEVL